MDVSFWIALLFSPTCYLNPMSSGTYFSINRHSNKLGINVTITAKMRINIPGEVVLNSAEK